MWSPSSWVLLTLPVLHGGCVRVCQQHQGLMQHTEVLGTHLPAAGLEADTGPLCRRGVIAKRRPLKVWGAASSLESSSARPLMPPSLDSCSHEGNKVSGLWDAAACMSWHVVVVQIPRVCMPAARPCGCIWTCMQWRHHA